MRKSGKKMAAFALCIVKSGSIPRTADSIHGRALTCFCFCQFVFAIEIFKHVFRWMFAILSVSFVSFPMGSNPRTGMARAHAQCSGNRQAQMQISINIYVFSFLRRPSLLTPQGGSFARRRLFFLFVVVFVVSCCVGVNSSPGAGAVPQAP